MKHEPKEHEREEEKKTIRAFATIFSDLQEHERKGLDEGGYKLEPFIARSNVVRPMHTPLKTDFFCLSCLHFSTFYHARLAVDHTLLPISYVIHSLSLDYHCRWPYLCLSDLALELP